MMPGGADVIDWLAGLLMQSVWITTIVALSVWVALRHLVDPRLVHRVVLTALLLIGVGLLTLGILQWPSTPPTPVASLAPASHGALQAGEFATPVRDVVAAIPEQPTAGWRIVLVGAWCVGLLVMSIRHTVGWWDALRLRQTAIILEGELAQRFADLCRAARMNAPLLLASTRLAVPAAIGWWRQAVILPLGLLTGLPADQIDALILHELAHLRRYDWPVELLVSLFESVLFFHPAVWWLGRRLRQAREQCCDDQALHAGAEPEGLTRALLALAERTGPHSPVLAATSGVLADRVRRILGMPERRERPWGALAAIALLPVLLVVVTACTTPTSTTRAKMHPGAPGPGADGGSAQEFSLARRIRAHADGRQVQLTALEITAPATFWQSLGLDGDRPARLDAAGRTRVLNAATGNDNVQVLQEAKITIFALQRAHTAFIHQYAYIADYQELNGVPDPIISVIDFGSVFDVRAEPVESGVLLVDVRCSSSELLGIEELTFPWTVEGNTKQYPLELPVIIADAGRADHDTHLGPGEVLALPLTCRVQRTMPTFPQVLDHGTVVKRISDPDLQARPRQVWFISAEVLDISDDHLTCAPEAAGWLDGTRVTLDLQHVPLAMAVHVLAAQLPVPVEVVRDADYEATQVDLIAQNEPARAVVLRLLAQCLLEGEADAKRLRLAAQPVLDFPGQNLEQRTAVAPDAHSKAK